MNPEEYTNLERVERDHWYYAGKREIVRHWIHRLACPPREARMLDCGAGTGLFALEMSGELDVHVLDNHEESLALLRSKFPEDKVYKLEGPSLPFATQSLDLLTALDVIEHIEDDRGAVAEFARVVKPGGHVVVTVPALMSLWSDWDVSLQHFRRYDRALLRDVFSTGDWDLLHLNYVNVFAFPPAWLIRRWRGWFPMRSQQGAVRMEDRIPGALLNRLLKWLFVRPACSRLPFPFGVGLILVARRRQTAVAKG